MLDEKTEKSSSKNMKPWKLIGFLDEIVKKNEANLESRKFLDVCIKSGN